MHKITNNERKAFVIFNSLKLVWMTFKNIYYSPSTIRNHLVLTSMLRDYIATPLCHIFYLSLQKKMCPQTWREAKVILLPKNGNQSISRPISLLLTFTKLFENIVFHHIQCYFYVNKLTVDL
jgi:hypothetical protein